MSELVKELRRAVECDPDPVRDGDLMRRAADEIERLQAELERWQDASQDSDGA